MVGFTCSSLSAKSVITAPVNQKKKNCLECETFDKRKKGIFFFISKEKLVTRKMGQTFE